MSTLNTTVRIKRSTSAGVVPSFASLADGELALNQKDGRLYYRGSESGEVSSFLDSDGLVSNFLTLSGGTLTGELVIPEITGASNLLAAATKQYVDAEVANAGVSDFPTGDYGDLGAADEQDAFGIDLFITYDSLTTPVGVISTTDLGSDSAI